MTNPRDGSWAFQSPHYIWLCKQGENMPKDKCDCPRVHGIRQCRAAREDVHIANCRADGCPDASSSLLSTTRVDNGRDVTAVAMPLQTTRVRDGTRLLDHPVPHPNTRCEPVVPTSLEGKVFNN